MSERTGSSQTEITVDDPDDFNRLQRFKEIHKARQNVARAFKTPETSSKPGIESPTRTTRERVAEAVSLYVLELEPLYRQSVDAGALSEDLGRFGDGYYEGEYEFEDIWGFAYRLGTVEKGSVTKSMSMQVFRIANNIMRRLGLELELTENETEDAGFDYSDILEEGPPGDGEKPDITADGVTE